MIKRKRSHFQWHSKSQVVQDADIQSYLMQVQLDKMGANLKASVKEEVEDDTSGGLGWAMDGGAAEEDWDQEAEEYDEEIEEEEVAEDGNDQEEDGEDQEEDHDSWTMKDWETTKAAGAGKSRLHGPASPASRSRHHFSARRTNGEANAGPMGGTEIIKANGGRNSAITLVA